MQVHGRTDELSLRSTFAVLPSGALMSLATNSLLNLCTATGWAEAVTSDGAAGDASGDAGLGGAEVHRDTGASAAPLVCAAVEPGEGSDQAPRYTYSGCTQYSRWRQPFCLTPGVTLRHAVTRCIGSCAYPYSIPRPGAQAPAPIAHRLEPLRRRASVAPTSREAQEWVSAGMAVPVRGSSGHSPAGRVG